MEQTTENVFESWKDWHVRLRPILEAYKSKNGLVDVEIGEAIGKSRSSVTHWKDGRRTPQLENFFRLCELIGADPIYVLFGKPITAANDMATRFAGLSQEGMQAVLIALEGAEARKEAQAHKEIKSTNRKTNKAA